jgi:hypothetical protein
MVTDMHYEARVNCVRNWYAEKKIKLTKWQAREVRMQPWQYMQVASFIYHQFVDCHLVSLACVFCVCRCLLGLLVTTPSAFRRW